MSPGARHPGTTGRAGGRPDACDGLLPSICLWQVFRLIVIGASLFATYAVLARRAPETPVPCATAATT